MKGHIGEGPNVRRGGIKVDQGETGIGKWRTAVYAVFLLNPIPIFCVTSLSMRFTYESQAGLASQHPERAKLTDGG